MKHRLTSRANLTLAGAVVATLCIAAVMPANAQQMGRDGWSFGGRNKSMAAQFEFTQRMQQSGASDGIAAFQQFVTTYNSSSTSIGNMNQINQNLSGGSSGTVSNGANQASHGNQGSSASTQTTVDNSVQQHNTDASTTPDQD